MRILAEFGYPYTIDTVNADVVPKFCWFYDIELNDLLLRPINLLEETTGETVHLSINGHTFSAPASWYLLVIDEETKLIDTVQVAKCSSSSHQALLLHPEESNYTAAPVVLLDLVPHEGCSHVMIPRMHMMLHPVGAVQQNSLRATGLSYSCLLSPQDLGKHLHGVTAMEILL